MSEPEASATRQRPNRSAVSEGETLSNGETAPRPETSRRFGRFRLGDLIGEGGMGQVHEALDPRLERTVALKLLRSDDAMAMRRFVREARIQAGVAHPGICPVFEAGDVDGRPYIVMQRLHGRPLDEAAADLPLEQKVVLIRQVAEAVHAAHRTGLIHRDLKPGNVLVESSPGGPPHPFVLDFGLARPVAGTGLTRAGDLIGTPAYMAPEQVRGENEHLDRRTDVYALGATLYRLLAGRVPFAGSAAATLVRVLAEEPRPLRPLGVPADLEAIVFKCLEKEPGRRYGSARELAEDLDRYLDGKPVRARPADGWYRLHKWLRRHRATVAVAAAAALLLVAVLGWGLWTAWRADERERLARAFTEQVEEVEAMVRYSHLSPLHDVRPDRVLLGQRMAAIHGALERAGKLGRGPGRHALGRGYLALDELEDARTHLSAAWDGGYQTAEVAAALGQTLSAIYRQRLASVELVRDWETRQRQQEELERIYGDPARFFLGQVAAGPSARYLEALVSFHAGQFEQALAKLTNHPTRRAWDYELYQLEGDVRRTWAMALAASEELDQAREQLRLAHTAYQRAATIAPSAPAIHRAAAQAAFQSASLDGSTGRDLAPFLRTGIEAASRALEADPDDGRAWLWRARLHRAAARELHNRSQNPTEELTRAIEASERATALLDEPSMAWRELGRAHSGWARWLDQRGEDSTEQLRRASDALDRVDSADRDYEFFVFLGQTRRNLADHRSSRGEPAEDDYARAIEAYRAATELHSEPFAAWVNLGSCHLAAAALPNVEDPVEILEQAKSALRAAEELRPDHVAPPYYLGRIALRLALGGRAGRVVADEELAQQAIAHYRRALELAPTMYQGHSGLGEVFHVLAIHAWDLGGEPGPLLAQAKAAFRRAGELAPESPIPWLNLAWSEYFESKYGLRGRGDPGPSLDAALRHAQRAWELSGSPFALLCRGSAYRLQAEHALLAGADPSQPFAAAETAFKNCLEENSELAEAQRSLGRLYTLEIRWRSNTGQPTADAIRRARAALDRARELEPQLASFWLADARWALAIPPPARQPSALEIGLAGAQRALEIRPQWPEALAARGTLFAALGDDLRAADDLRRALAANSHLAFEWQPQPEVRDRR